MQIIFHHLFNWEHDPVAVARVLSYGRASFYILVI